MADSGHQLRSKINPANISHYTENAEAAVMAASDLVAEHFLPNKHKKYFVRCMQVLPDRYVSLDTSRMTVAFFAISGLDMLNALDAIEKEKNDIIRWVYSMQVLPDQTASNLDQCGFRGSPTVRVPLDSQPECRQYDSGHIAMTYTALLLLLILGDDLSEVNRYGLVSGLRRLQLADGSFCPTPDAGENDMRFIYCACCISYILGDWDGMDVDQANSYIRNSLSYDGAFGQGPGLESHGGSTFCAVASLVLMDRLHSTLSDKQIGKLIRWCVMRQQSGFQGRPNKPADTCYSFWVGATLKLLGAYDLTNKFHNHSFLMDTQHNLLGGFAKWPDSNPDVLHAYFGVCGLSLMDEPGLKVMHAALNVSKSATNHLRALYASPRSPESFVKERVSPTPENFCSEEYVTFFKRCLSENIATQHNDGLDLSRLRTFWSSLSSLDLLKALDTIDCDMKCAIADSIYQCQAAANDDSCGCGFKSSALDQTADLGATYYGLCSLLLLRDDCTRIDTEDVVDWLRRLQSESGGFHQKSDRHEGWQTNMKCNYWAACISYLIGNWSGIDRDHLTANIMQSQTPDGGFAERPGLEATVEASFHALATLVLTGNLQTSVTGTSLSQLRQFLQQQLHGVYNKERPDSHEIARVVFWEQCIVALLGCATPYDVLASVESITESNTALSYPHHVVPSMSPSNIEDMETCRATVCGAALMGHPELCGLDVPLHLSTSSIQYRRTLHDRKRTS